MKKFFQILAIVALGIFATSCATDLTDDLAVSTGDVEVSFTTGLPSRTISDGSQATKLYVQAFAVQDSELKLAASAEADVVDLKATVNLKFVQGMTYKVVFWAQHPSLQAPTFADNQAEVSIDYSDANDESRDAFYQLYEFTVNGPANHPVKLYRPFAQLNVGTSDLAEAESLGFSLSGVKVEASAYTSLDLLTGAASDLQPVTFEATTIATTDKLNGLYDWLSFNYLLVGKEQHTLNEVKVTISNKYGSARVITESGVPVKRNYRTNLVGSLLTTDNGFNVELLPEYGHDDKYGVLDGEQYIRVSTAEEFYEAFANEHVDIIILEEDIVLSESKTRAASVPCLAISSGKALTIDLDGHKLSSTSSETGKNYNMFDVVGTLTVKNGTIESQHVGDNMGWSNSTNLFNVTAGGVLNIEGVTAKNLGGSDMAFVAHLNNWGEVTLNVKNSVLESPYIAVRVYNSGNDMNNVTIKGSTLKGTRSFWVHNYSVADFGTQEKADAHKALLNFDIFNDQANPSSDDNTFIYDEENKLGPVCYGFTDDIYFDQYGNQIPAFIPILDAEGNEVAGVAYDPASATEVGGETVYNTIVVTDDPGLTWVAANVVANDGFAGKTIRLEADVDLEGIKTNGETFAPIGVRTGNDKPFKGTFDGNGKTISNLNQSGWDLGYQWGAFGGLGLFGTVEDATIKNLTIKDMVSRVEGGEIGAIAACAKGDCTFENITIESGDLGTYNNGLGGIVGYTEGGHFVFKDITLGEDVSLGGLWGSFDSSIGGIVGQADANSSYLFENVEINCRVDAYNDVTAAYKHYAYRMCGMIIGWVPKTQNDNGTTRPDPAANNVTCTNVTVNYGAWMNYTYCDNCCKRLEPGYEYGGHTCDNPEHTHTVRPFDQIFGGGQYGVYGLAAYDGVTVNYPTNN